MLPFQKHYRCIINIADQLLFDDAAVNYISSQTMEDVTAFLYISAYFLRFKLLHNRHLKILTIHLH